MKRTGDEKDQLPAPDSYFSIKSVICFRIIRCKKQNKHRQAIAFELLSKYGHTAPLFNRKTSWSALEFQKAFWEIWNIYAKINDNTTTVFSFLFLCREASTQVSCIIVSSQTRKTRIQSSGRMSLLTSCLFTKQMTTPFALSPSGNKSGLLCHFFFFFSLD